MLVLDLFFFCAACTSYLCSYSQQGLFILVFIHVLEFSLLILHSFLLNLIIFKVDVTVFWGGICCFMPC